MILRPSGAGIWVKCALYRTLALPNDSDVDEDVTVREEGTACHWLASTPGAKVGDMAPNGVQTDEEMAEAVALYRSVLAAWPVPAILETPVHCKGIHGNLHGTPDAMAYDAATGTLYVADLKYGFRWVPHVKNWQLLCYADGAAWLLVGASIMAVARIVFTIVQPRCYTADSVRTFECVPSDILPELETLQLAAWAAHQPNPPATINAGCRDCSGRHRCATFINAAAGYVEQSRQSTPVDLTFDAMERELRNIKDAIRVMSAYESALETQVAFQMKQGKRSRFFEMSQDLTPLQWNPDAIETVRGLAKLMGASIDKEPKPITPTQAKAVLGEKIVNMYARRHQKPAKLRLSDEQVMMRLFGK